MIIPKVPSSLLERHATIAEKQQIAVAHNAAVADMVLLNHRQGFEVYMREHPFGSPEAALRASDSQAPQSAAVGGSNQAGVSTGETSEETERQSMQTPCTDVDPDVDEDADDILAELTDAEISEQEALSAALALTNIALMPDTVLFPEHEEF
ncbi:hypothetical protein PR001_g3293 [Phytophthora rubi]|uniref:Uncharacterized protein n=3 Tax=Phytophthora rubi TaxID=129364 RepID=A0A6A3NKC6_9STRA|nr:hypothetical protein PR002_g2535 [Phytophthora rubi]KAE9049478.1 hypothetical protein PR001_g3293 [Phytophthora rubi]